MCDKAKKISDEKATDMEREVPNEIETKPSQALNDQCFRLGNDDYQLVTNYREAFDYDLLQERYTDILSRYDYIVADWGYDQIRLKGFFSDERKKISLDSRISTLQDYLYEYCNFGCAYFVIKKISRATSDKVQQRTNKIRHKRQSQSDQAHTEEVKRSLPSESTKKRLANQHKNKPKRQAKPVEKKQTAEGRHFTIRQNRENS